MVQSIKRWSVDNWKHSLEDAEKFFNFALSIFEKVCSITGADKDEFLG